MARKMSAKIQILVFLARFAPKMDDDSLLLYTSFILATVSRKKKDKKIKAKRKEWIKGWLANRARLKISKQNITHN